MKSLKFLSIIAISCCFSLSHGYAKETIYLISSSSAYDESYIPMIVKSFNNKGFNVSTQYLDQRLSDFGYVNTDRERAKNLVNALSNPQVKYLWFVRGGSGALNLLPILESKKEVIKKTSPKVLIGFSDVTVIHYFINNYIGWKSIHGTTAASGRVINASSNSDLSNQAISSRSANNALVQSKQSDESSLQTDAIEQIFSSINNGIKYQGLLPLNQSAHVSQLNGRLTGGNLTLVQTLFSTTYEKNWNNKVLLLEDVNVTYKQLDRLLHQLLFKKDFHPKAIVFGQFYPNKTNDGERLIYKQVIQSYADQTNIPVYYYPYFGHGKVNQPFILGENAKISCNKDSDYCSIVQNKM
ncbi:Murein tetrapeptide carboxypeptidase [Acinetobacter stercoris]|uniref:Murein tetrapeptide carboxypeptidase n=1 Tax=Acinetobacter stercoris TaxID=2126983 RepID=A0A2U3MXP0_9GAMM|nr:Murein tetrapeptide carboxypeptidase [Acinetobacter stercoris]